MVRSIFYWHLSTSQQFSHNLDTFARKGEYSPNDELETILIYNKIEWSVNHLSIKGYVILIARLPVTTDT